MSLVVEKLSLGEEIDRVWQLREGIEKDQKALDERKKVLEARKEALLTRITEEGVAGAQGTKAKVSVSEQLVGNVENWDEFHAYLRRTNQLFLLERRVANAAYRELLANRKGKAVPGIVPFKRRTLNLRTV